MVFLKIKLLHSLLIVDILTVCLVLAVVFIPSSPVRIVLGLPFLLFFPGYVLVEALFVKRKGQAGSDSQELSQSGMDGLERAALGFGLSIAVVALISLGLNYTPWGIRLEPVLYSISAFILVFSLVALYRQVRYFQAAVFDAVPDERDFFQAAKEMLLTPVTFRMPGLDGSPLNKVLSVILAVAVLGAVGALVYTVAVPKTGERFTEFYILGYQGKADNYPAVFTLVDNRVTQVSYGGGAYTSAGSRGQVTLGIVNQEQEPAAYSVEVRIDGETVPFELSRANTGAAVEGAAAGSPGEMARVVLEQGQKWEQEIGFAPLHTGEDQKVEFLLYKEGSTGVYNRLHLWIDVR